MWNAISLVQDWTRVAESISYDDNHYTTGTSFTFIEFKVFKYFYVKVKLPTVVEGDQMAPFSIATTPRCRGGRYSFSLDCSTLPLMLTLYCWVLSKEVSSTIFKVFGVTRPGIEPRSPGSLANTLPTGPMSRLCNTNNMATVTWFQLYSANTNNLLTLLLFQDTILI